MDENLIVFLQTGELIDQPLKISLILFAVEKNEFLVLFETLKTNFKQNNLDNLLQSLKTKTRTRTFLVKF